MLACAWWHVSSPPPARLADALPPLPLACRVRLDAVLARQAQLQLQCDQLAPPTRAAAAPASSGSSTASSAPSGTNGSVSAAASAAAPTAVAAEPAAVAA